MSDDYEGPGNLNEILSFHHCGMCLAELPPDTSPKEYARQQAGFTKLGIQIWCNRHDVNIMHVDFQGQRHPANMTARLPSNEDKG
jgi:hypothetical protein